MSEPLQTLVSQREIEQGIIAILQLIGPAFQGDLEDLVCKILVLKKSGQDIEVSPQNLRGDTNDILGRWIGLGRLKHTPQSRLEVDHTRQLCGQIDESKSYDDDEEPHCQCCGTELMMIEDIHHLLKGQHKLGCPICPPEHQDDDRD